MSHPESFQALIERIYLERDAARGIPGTLLWFVEEVGERLARWALARTYGRKGVVYSGPLYKSMQVDGKKVRLSFAHVGGGLRSRDGKPLILLDIPNREFTFFGATFLPTDTFLLMLLLFPPLGPRMLLISGLLLLVLSIWPAWLKLPVRPPSSFSAPS
mgnify:CR=1 FL=1